MKGSRKVQRRCALSRSVMVVTALAVVTVLPGCRPDVESTQSAVQVFEGARLIAGDGSAPIEDAVFIVREGKIEQVGQRDTLEVPDGASRVDLAGKTVMPMLINVHGHIGYLKGASMDAANFTRENIIDALRRHQYYGVGVALKLGTDRNDLELQVRDEQRSGTLSDPTLAMLLSTGAGFVAPNDGGPTGAPAFSRDVALEAGAEEEGRQYVRELAAKNVDGIKMWVDDRGGQFPKMKPEVYRAIIDEAHQHDLKVFIHATDLADAKDVVRSGVDALAHPVRRGPIDDEFIQLMKEHGVYQCSTVGVGDKAWMDEPVLAETMTAANIALLKAQFGSTTEAQAEAHALLLENLKRESDAGVPIVLCGDEGTDLEGEPGFAEHLELQGLAEAGIAPLQIIRAGTQAPAELLGLSDMGTLSSGKRADFIVLNSNPLERMANTRDILAVYKSGQAIDRAAMRAAWTGSASSDQ